MISEKEFQLNMRKQYEIRRPEVKTEMKGIWTCLNIGHDFSTRRFSDLSMRVIPVFL